MSDALINAISNSYTTKALAVTGLGTGLGALGTVVYNATQAGDLATGIKNSMNVDQLKGKTGQVVTAVAITFIALVALGLAIDAVKHFRGKDSRPETEAEKTAREAHDAAKKTTTEAEKKMNSAKTDMDTAQSKMEANSAAKGLYDAWNKENDATKKAAEKTKAEGNTLVDAFFQAEAKFTPLETAHNKAKETEATKKSDHEAAVKKADEDATKPKTTEEKTS